MAITVKAVTVGTVGVAPVATAAEAGAGTLIIGHFSGRYKDISVLVDEARSVFPRTLAALDGKTYEVQHINDL